MVSAHSADFVWRAAGAIATVTSQGGTAVVVSLSYGERGESGELWKEEGQTIDNVKAVRRGEAETAAGSWAPRSSSSTGATTRSSWTARPSPS